MTAPRAQRSSQKVALICAALAITAARSLAQAPPTLAPDAENPLHAWLPSQEAHDARERARFEAALERALAQLPGVDAAVVHVSPAASQPAALDQAPPPLQLAIVLHQKGRGPSEQRVRALADALAPAEARPVLSVSRIHVPAAVAPSAPALAASTRVGPFWVASRSAQGLRYTLAACLVSNIALALALLFRRRGRRA